MLIGLIYGIRIGRASFLSSMLMSRAKEVGFKGTKKLRKAETKQRGRLVLSKLPFPQT